MTAAALYALYSICISLFLFFALAPELRPLLYRIKHFRFTDLRHLRTVFAMDRNCISVKWTFSTYVLWVAHPFSFLCHCYTPLLVHAVQTEIYSPCVKMLSARWGSQVIPAGS